MTAILPDLYYRHSGRAPISSIIFSLGSGLIGGAVLAAIYAYLIYYIPLGGYISFLLTFGCGWALGWLMARCLRWGSVRNVAVATLMALVVGLVTLYVAWAVWLYVLLGQAYDNVTLLPILSRPDVMWELILAINETGAWSMNNFTPTGIVLWLIWLAEAIIIVGAAVWYGRSAVAEPYCETCFEWTTAHPGVLVTAAGEAETVKNALERRDLPFLRQLGPATDPSTFLRFDLHSCQECGAFHTLTVSACALQPQKDGSVKIKARPVVRHLLIGPAEVEQIRQIDADFEAAAQQDQAEDDAVAAAPAGEGDEEDANRQDAAP